MMEGSRKSPAKKAEPSASDYIPCPDCGKPLSVRKGKWVCLFMTGGCGYRQK